MSDWKFSTSEVMKINKQREDYNSLYYMRRLIKSIEGLNLLLRKRREFWENYHVMHDEFVLWGRYLLTFRGTIQEIDQHYLCGNPVEITTLPDFMKIISSLRTKEVTNLPTRSCVCSKCHKLIKIEDIAKGNFEPCGTQFVHKIC